ncbi:MAG: hypothetical protein ABIK65_00855 [Candidatus Eisenbacteria bacterium]
MRQIVVTLGSILLLAGAGCIGRGDSGEEGDHAAGAWESEASSGKEILRFLDETGRSDEVRFAPADRDPFAAVRGAAAPAPPPARIAVRPHSPEPAPPLRLVGILRGEEGATARIGTGAYHAGDHVRGFEIIAVGEDHIILERDGTRHTVKVGRMLPGPGEGGLGS